MRESSHAKAHRQVLLVVRLENVLVAQEAKERDDFVEARLDLGIGEISEEPLHVLVNVDRQELRTHVHAAPRRTPLVTSIRVHDRLKCL